MYIIDTEGKKRKCVEVECEHCKVKFLKPSRFIKEGRGNFCCKEHQALYQNTQVKVKCSWCGKDKEVKKNWFDRVSQKSGHFFCDRNCQVEAQKSDSGSNYECNIKNGRFAYRRIALDNKEKKCILCGYDEYEVALDVHHIDGDKNNNSLDNLAILCSICHRLVHNKIKRV